MQICWPSGGCSQHISIVRISPLREQIGIHASLLLLWEQRPKVGAVKEVLLTCVEPLCPKTFPPLFSLFCVPDTCLEKDSLRHAGSLTEFSCIQEKKIQARQPLKSWRRIYTDTQVGHICEAHILVWGADKGESLETWKLVAQMQNLRWQKKVSRKYCLVIHLLKIYSRHPTFENIVTSSNFLQLPGNSVSDRLRPLRYITQHSLSKYQDGDQALLRKPFFILLLVTLSPSELHTLRYYLQASVIALNWELKSF